MEKAELTDLIRNPYALDLSRIRKGQ
jgi:hypothetical protein